MQPSETSALTFPCRFPIKAMGEARDDLDAEVAAIVRRHAPDLGEAAITRRASREGNYLSITVVVNAVSQAQLDAIYQDLHDCEHILMVL